MGVEEAPRGLPPADKESPEGQLRDLSDEFLKKHGGLPQLIKINRKIVIISRTTVPVDGSTQQISVTSFEPPWSFDAVLQPEAIIKINQPGSKAEVINGLKNIPENLLPIINGALARHLSGETIK